MSTDEFNRLLGDLLVVSVGIEFVKLLIRHRLEDVIDVMMLATARQMVVEHLPMTSMLVAVCAIGVLFAIRRFLFMGSDLNFFKKKSNKTEEETETKLEKAKNELDGQPTNFEELQGYIDREEAVLNSHEFYNADPEKRALYEKRIKDAKALLTKENVTQTDVEEIAGYLYYIVKSLDGKETDKSELSKLVKDLENKTKEDKYTKAEDSRKIVYDLAVEEAQKILSKEKATQEEVNLAKKQLAAARDALNGDRIRREDLQNLVDESNSKNSNEKYYNADDDRKVAYDKAIEDVKELLSKRKYFSS